MGNAEENPTGKSEKVKITHGKGRLTEEEIEKVPKNAET